MDANIQNIACLGKIMSEKNFETWLLLRKHTEYFAKIVNGF